MRVGSISSQDIAEVAVLDVGEVEELLVDFDFLFRAVGSCLDGVDVIVLGVAWFVVAFLVLVGEIRACDEYQNAADEPAGCQDGPWDVVTAGMKRRA